MVLFDWISYSIGKHMLYYNGENVGRLSPLFRRGIFFILCSILLFMICYGFWLTKHLGKISEGIGDISMRSYTRCLKREFLEKSMGRLIR